MNDKQVSYADALRLIAGDRDATDRVLMEAARELELMQYQVDTLRDMLKDAKETAPDAGKGR